MPAAEEVVAVSIVSVEEQMRGWLAAIARERQARRQVFGYGEFARLFDYFRAFTILLFDDTATDQFDNLRAAKIRLGTMDLKIAAIALVNKALLLSANRRDFEQVPGLRVENWLNRRIGRTTMPVDVYSEFLAWRPQTRDNSTYRPCRFPRLTHASPPAAGPAAAVAVRAEPAAPTPWAFRKPVRVDPPAVSDPDWAKNPIDAFILARLDKAGLKPSPPALRSALLRRVTYDLTGLPPTLKELDDFLADDRPDAYARVVDRLLASPHFGERQAQHWLDVVRYAESNGYEADGERPNAWRYRDYVVKAFNDDKPYDRFLTEQLAGDLLAGEAARKGVSGTDKAEAEWLIAAGFNRCGPAHQTSGNVDAALLRQEMLTEMTNGVGAAFLGLTVGCARCHDHKFDPIPQADYYRLQAFFSAAQPKDIDLSTPDERADFAHRAEETTAKTAPLLKQAADIEAPVRERLREAKKARLEAPYREALAVAADQRTPEQKKLAEQADVLLKITWDEIVDALPPAEREKRAALRNRPTRWRRNGRRRRPRRGPSPRTAPPSSPTSSSAAA